MVAGFFVFFGEASDSGIAIGGFADQPGRRVLLEALAVERAFPGRGILESIQGLLTGPNLLGRRGSG